ncbi:MAG: phosphotransferase [Clostridia bacterium]|nr:phosphotransferase [Clostridia bacterium]
MNFKNESGKLVLFFEGRIDSYNADQRGAEIQQIIDENPHEEITFDLDQLEYISSAGLRIVLRIRKSEPTLTLINASPDVYDIFDMTGFTEMIPVVKAYRKFSIDGCEVIGAGANGVVYRLNPDTIIKVYKNPDSLPDIQRERELARKAFVLGIPTAIPYDVVKVGDKFGSVFELLNAQPFANLIAADMDRMDYYIDLYVELLKKIHSTQTKAGEMPDMKATALKWAEFLKDYLSEEEYGKLYSLINEVPEDNHIVHGDCHIKNVMMQNGEVLLIDMDTLCLGHPIFEFSSMFLAYGGINENHHEKTMDFLGLPYEVAVEIWYKTLKKYFGTDDENKIKEYSDKAKVVGYTRIIRRMIRRHGLENEEDKKDIELFMGNLKELLKTVDTLMF